MNHKIDKLTRFRRFAWPEIHAVKKRVGGFGLYRLPRTERVGVIEKPVQEVVPILRELGFGREPVAALKKRRDSDLTKSAGSWKLIDPHDEEMQLHVTLFALDSGTEVNAHYEYRWEPWAPYWKPYRAVQHYRPREHGHYSPEEGVAMVVAMFEEHGIEYTRDYEEYHDND